MQRDVRELVAKHAAPIAVLRAPAGISGKNNQSAFRIGYAGTPFRDAVTGDRIEFRIVGGQNDVDGLAKRWCVSRQTGKAWRFPEHVDDGVGETRTVGRVIDRVVAKVDARGRAPEY